MCEINCAIDTFLPLQTIKKHPTDRPWTKKIKNCIYRFPLNGQYYPVP